jgi:hypothetical protein
MHPQQMAPTQPSSSAKKGFLPGPNKGKKTKPVSIYFITSLKKKIVCFFLDGFSCTSRARRYQGALHSSLCHLQQVPAEGDHRWTEIFLVALLLLNLHKDSILIR